MASKSQIARYSHAQLMELANRHGVEALCDSQLYRNARGGIVPEFPFTWTTTLSPPEFLHAGDEVFDGPLVQYWLLQGDKAALGTLGNEPKGLPLVEFMQQLAATKVTPTMRAVATLLYAGEYDFEVFTGDLNSLVTDAKKYIG